MAKKVTFKLNRAGVRELLQSSEMQGIIKEKADQVLATAGEGYESKVQVMGTRVVADVHADTPKAYNQNLKHNTLLKALGSAK